jgi:2-succinyl-6-hydroxy-2,4-cyclohexadiene-1-carboxylate synthase
VTALHGFLGLPGDWDKVFPEDEFGAVSKPSWVPLLNGLTGDRALHSLAKALNKRAQGDETLVGYSMGGRIALHMLLEGGAHLWRGAVIVSASPGLPSEAERERRAAQDARWADRFRRDPWRRVVADWNAQPVFAADPPLRRDESDFDREQLANALERGSVGLQADLRPALRALDIPVLWIAGEQDEKYAALAEECAALNPAFEFTILDGSGHRAPWTATEQFRRAVKAWIDR